MLNLIKSYIAPPTFEDEQEQIRALLLHVTILTMQILALFVPMLLALFNRGTIFTATVAAGVLVAILFGGLLFLLHRHRLTFTSWATILFLLFAVTGTAYAFNGLRDPTISLLIFVVVIGGLLLSNRTAIGVITLIALLLILSLFVLESLGIVTYASMPFNVNHLFWPALTIGLVGGLVGVSIRNLNDALQRARESEEAAEMANEQLEAMNLELEGRVAARTRALQLSADVSRRLSTILDQGELVRAVVNQLQQTFNYYHVHIYLLDEEGEQLHMVGGTGEAGRQMLEQGHAIAVGRGLVGRAAKTNLPVLVSNVAEEPGWLANPLLPETRAEIAVPIARADDVIGVLDVQHNVRGGLTEEDVELIRSLTNQIAVALQNARLYRQAQERAEEQQLLNTITERIQATTSVEQALQVAVRELGWAMNGPARVTLEPGRQEVGALSSD